MSTHDPTSAANPLAAADLQRGVGGHSVLSRTSEEEEEVLLPPPQNGDPEPTSAVLLSLGVFVLAPARRRQVAVSLTAAGITTQDVRDVAAFIRSSEPDEGKLRRYLASIFSSPERAKESVAGLGEFKKAATPTGSSVTHQRGFPCPYWTCTCQDCANARAAGRPDQGPRPNYLLDGPQSRAVTA